MSGAELIGIDWGTTNLRAFRFDRAGKVVETVETAQGVASLKAGEHQRIVEALVARWSGQGVGPPVVISGMAGSTEGWGFVPHRQCPASAATLAQTLAIVDERRRWAIVPGLRLDAADGSVDLMRGEETQAFGCGLEDGIVLAPGTHAKWIELRSGRIVAFRTYPTGEIFALLRDHSFIARSASRDSEDWSAFAEGVALGAKPGEAAGALLRRAFGIRARLVAGALAASAVHDALSGLLIGAEIADAIADRDADTPIVLVAQPGLAVRYGAALRQLGRPASVVIDGAAAAAAGLWRLSAKGRLP